MYELKLLTNYLINLAKLSISATSPDSCANSATSSHPLTSILATFCPGNPTQPQPITSSNPSPLVNNGQNVLRILDVFDRLELLVELQDDTQGRSNSGVQIAPENAEKMGRAPMIEIKSPAHLFCNMPTSTCLQHSVKCSYLLPVSSLETKKAKTSNNLVFLELKL